MTFSICLDTQIYGGPQCDRGCWEVLLTSDSRGEKELFKSPGISPVNTLSLGHSKVKNTSDSHIDLGVGTSGVKGPSRPSAYPHK